MTDSYEEIAVKAVKEFNRITPILTSFASALAGRKLIVKAGTGTFTDGKEITIRPPDELAQPRRHNKSLCEKRDPDTNKLLCSGCARTESLYYRLQHEMAHCIYGTQDKIAYTGYDIKKIRETAEEHGTAEFVKTITERNQAGEFTCMQIGNNYGPQVRDMVNFIEDKRIEYRTGMTRPGFIPMSWNQHEIILRNGVPDAAGNIVTWQDMDDKDRKIMAMWLFDSHGHDISSFDDEMIEHLEMFKKLYPKEPVVPFESVDKAVAFVGFMNTLGYFESFFEESQGGDESADGEGEQAGAGPVQTDDDASGDPGTAEDKGSNKGEGEEEDIEPGSFKITEDKFIEILSNGCSANHDHDNSDYEDGEAGSKIPDEVLVTIINQSENWDEFNINMGGLEQHHKGEEWERALRNTSIDKPSVRTFGSATIRARRIFSDSKLDKNYHGLKKGKLDAKSLGKRAWNEDDRLFKRKIRAQGISSEVCIGLDISGSTGAVDDTGESLCTKIAKIGYITAELLYKIDVDFSIHAHTTGHSFGNISQEIYTIKDVGERWDNTSRDRCLRLAPRYGSLDGHNFEFYRKILQRSRAQRKLLIYFTDGVIPETYPAVEKPIMLREFEILKKSGIAMLGVGMYTDSPKRYGMDTVLVTESTDISTVLKEIEKRIVSVQ